MKLQRNDTLVLDFDSGIEVKVDLSAVEMTDEQREAVNRLAAGAPQLDSAECVDDRCPAQELLSDRDFELVRGLKAQLGADAADSPGPFIDFCLHIHIVGKVEGRGVPRA